VSVVAADVVRDVTSRATTAHSTRSKRVRRAIFGFVACERASGARPAAR
jgi:hypothetical protein